jgi:O-antigen ligase
MISRIEEKRQALESTFRGYTAEEARKLSIHSQLLVSLAEGGILGGAFFLGLGALVLKTLRSLTVSSVPYRAFLFYIVLTGAWNLLMSPFSGVARVEIALLVCTGLLVILQRQGELPEDERE